MWDEPAHRRVGRRHDLVGLPAGTVATTCTGSSANAAIAVSTRSSSPCCSDDVVTRTIGRSIDSNQSGVVSGSGSSTQGPIICTASPQSVWGYWNGLPLATRISGARRKNSSTDATACTSTLARIELMGGSITLSRRPITAVRTAASRSRPNTPGSGWRPRPNGGTPGDRSGGVYGEKHTHGMPPASAADSAPQQFTSTSKASG